MFVIFVQHQTLIHYLRAVENLKILTGNFIFVKGFRKVRGARNFDLVESKRGNF